MGWGCGGGAGKGGSLREMVKVIKMEWTRDSAERTAWGTGRSDCHGADLGHIKPASGDRRR